MICEKCKGRGYITNSKLFNVPSWKAYEKGYDKPIKCSKCGGRGFIIGNTEGVIKILDIAIQNRTPLSITELKQIKRILEHEPEQTERESL